MIWCDEKIWSVWTGIWKKLAVKKRFFCLLPTNHLHGALTHPQTYKIDYSCKFLAKLNSYWFLICVKKNFFFLLATSCCSTSPIYPKAVSINSRFIPHLRRPYQRCNFQDHPRLQHFHRIPRKPLDFKMPLIAEWNIFQTKLSNEFVLASHAFQSISVEREIS